MRNISPTKQKILLLLLGGLAFGYSYTPKTQWRVLKQISYEWKKINKEKLRKDINQLYQTKLIRRKENSDGSYTIELTEKGQMKSLTYHFEKMIIKGENWDGKWRLIVFDIPENKRKGRDALRDKIKKLGFYELQKSVWVFPYECKNEIDFITEFFGLKKYVRFGILESIDNELHLKKIFNLN
jgi:DNA-binding transcriptional regulator PaaX